jgi:hypothetical protein
MKTEHKESFGWFKIHAVEIVRAPGKIPEKRNQISMPIEWEDADRYTGR